MFNEVYKTPLLEKDKFYFFGGEHSISIGIIKAFYEKFKTCPFYTLMHMQI